MKKTRLSAYIHAFAIGGKENKKVSRGRGGDHRGGHWNERAWVDYKYLQKAGEIKSGGVNSKDHNPTRGTRSPKLA